MKSALALLLLAGLLAVTTQPACADTNGKRIAAVVSSTKNPFIANVASTMEKEGAALGMKVSVLSANYDAAVQAQQIIEAVAQHVDFIAVIPLDPRAIVPALTRAKEAGIPVLIVNSPIDPAYDHLFVAFVGEDHEILGRVAGESLVRAVSERPRARTAIISGTLAESTPQMRIKGFKAAVAAEPKIEIVATEDARWDMANSERIAGQLFARYAAQGGLDAVYAMADNMAHGVIQAAKAADIGLGTAPGKLVVVSSNCLKFGMDHIRAGEQYSTGAQMPGRTGKAAIGLIADALNGKTIQRKNILPTEAITRANLDGYVEACTF